MKPDKIALDIKNPASALFVGNSLFYYNNSLHGHFNSLTGKEMRCTSVTINGSSLSWHAVESYFNAERIGSYSFNEKNEVVFNDPKRKMFDITIMVDSTQGPTHPLLRDDFFKYAKIHSDTVRKHGTEPVFFMSWAYADKPEMTEQLAEGYTIAGNDNNALVIPTGLAFAASVKERPDINLYQPDKRHPSVAGTYLAACAIYGALFGVSPEGNAYTAGLPLEECAFLQNIAWKTLGNYYA